MSKSNKKHNKGLNTLFKYSLLASAVIGVTSAPVYAQEKATEDEDDVVEVIDVRGVRGNLIKAQDMRREGETLLDALSASDIGVLPDRSVLEAISRVPGVSIGRFAAPNDPDHFGTEGSGLVVRGLTQVRSEFNGRDTFTANSGRSLSFEDVPPELIGSVEVFKNQTADMVEGGIAGTVNLNTKKPFDSGERIIAFSADATYADFIEETTPSFSFLYSDVFESDAGRFGLLLNASTSELKAQSDATQVGQFTEQNAQVDGQTVFVPRSGRFARKQDDRERQGFAAVLQYENTERTLEVTAEFIRSDANLAWTENAVEFGDDDRIGDLVPAEGTQYEFDDQGYFQNGVISSTAGWRGPDEYADRAPGGVFGNLHSMVSRAREDDSSVQDISFNVKYTPNDTWAFNFDVQRVDADTQIQDFQVQGGTRAAVSLDLTQGSTPRIGLFNPAYTADNPGPDGDHFTNPNRTFWRSAMDHVSDNEGQSTAYRFDAKYTLDSGFITAITTGVRYSDRDQTTRESTYNWGNLSTPWAGGGITWFDDPATQSLPTDLVSFDNFGKGGVLDIEGGNTILFPGIELAKNYRDAVNPDSPFNILAAQALPGGWAPLSARGNVIPGTDFTPGEINETSETSTALYAKANFDGELGDMDYQGNFGLRYVKLENDTFGSVIYPDNLIDGPEDLDNFLPADQAAFGNDTSVPSTVSDDYTNVLPSFNIKLNLNEDMLMRVGISEAIALPQLGLLRNYVNIQGVDRTTVTEPDPNGGEPIPVLSTIGRYIANSGNPNLKPMESYNFDVTFEWYFAEAGSLTTSLFYKDLKNYFINDARPREFTNNGSTQTVLVSGAYNGDEGKIQGFEVAYQQFFDFLPEGFDGLGAQFNYTYVDEEGSPNANLSPDAPGDAAQNVQAFENLPLEGLSKHTMNITALYEKDKINARLAYNWRSEYLLTTRDVITALPIFSEGAGYLDASIFYQATDNIQVGFQATNITDTESVTQMQVTPEGDRRTRGVFVNDSRYSFIVRGNF
ncbi:TonB-dependent receptor [Alteromonas sp. W364]|uniref:TonB-dependent receptor n=1 Tax=Alteromonas sp. W364 TaxID=3075610 RepID=UPI0028875E80|nr:TonB-dependent receptor [Alteromonas sp. W364]MDT0628641.1 TonB-dependent receptor [Alteromonas sp. W364]